MTQITHEQRTALETAGWTEEEAMGFAQAIRTFRDSLPPRQREAFTAVVATAGTAAGESDVQGYFSGLIFGAVLTGIVVGYLVTTASGGPDGGGQGGGITPPPLSREPIRGHDGRPA